MIEFYKKRGETPLQALERLRKEQDLFEEILSYAGRLDPMAEGILPVLVGKEENKNRADFLSKNKEYRATFLLGVSTDTGDVLGLIEQCKKVSIEDNQIIDALDNLRHIQKQTYPWYSSKTVEGVPLFEYARKGMFDIVRPEKLITVFDLKNIKIEKVDMKSLVQKNIQDIEKVVGDFRQEKIIQSWERETSDLECDTLVVMCDITVSSGTYIRGFAQTLSEILHVPVTLQALIRTKVF